MKHKIGETISKIIECDVVVVGGSAAGLEAAIRAKDIVNEVVVVEKSKVARSGCATFLAGILLACFPEDNKMAWINEMVDHNHGCYLNDQEWAKIYVDDSYQRVLELDKWGQEKGLSVFEKDETGKFIRRRSRGHVKTKHLLVRARNMMDTLKKEALGKGVRLVERVMAIELLVHDGKAVGVIGLDYRGGDVYLFKAKAIVIAAGALGSKYIFLAKGNLSGDLVAAAFRAGVTLQNMELTTSNLTAADYNTHGMNLSISVGGKFLNALGEEFMPLYNPELGNRAVLHDLVIAMCREVMEGRGPIYLDITAATREDEEMCRRLLPESFIIWDRAGINPFKEKVKWVPAFHGHIGGADSGGVRINTKCETDIVGLYAAGDTAVRSAHGGLGGGAIGFAIVSGYRAGNYSAEFAKKMEPYTWEDEKLSENVRSIANDIVKPMKEIEPLAEFVTPDEMIYNFQKTLIQCPVIYVRNESRLKEALKNIRKLKENSTKLKATDLHELVKAIEVKNMITIAEISLIAALERKESRIEHFREDYPRIDNEKWLKRINIKKDGGKIKLWTEEVETPYVKPPKGYLIHSGARRRGL